MWAIRVLTGPQAGKVYPLKLGSNTLGQSPECDIVIASSGVSREHARIEVSPQGLALKDNRSANGSFVNGVAMNHGPVRPGDKIALHDVVVEVIPFAANMAAMGAIGPGLHPSPHMTTGALAHEHTPEANSPHLEAVAPMAAREQDQEQDEEEHASIPQGLTDHVRHYVDNVVLPGVYTLTDIMEFKWVLGLFMAGFIVLVTSMSTIPLMAILKSSIEKESQARALTIARNLAETNRSALVQGTESALSVQSAMKEAGVEKAYIVSNLDGQILAPARLATSYPDDPFVHSARKGRDPSVQQIDDEHIGAAFPIAIYDSEMGQNRIRAYAFVYYNMGSLAVDDARTINLFVQTLFIALIVGGILFFFLYAMIQHPISLLNSQIDQALKERTDDVEISFNMPSFQKLVSNVRSTLSRAMSAQMGSESNGPVEFDRNNEMNNIIQIVGYPAIVVAAADYHVAAVNPGFEEITGLSMHDILHQPVSDIRDQSLRLSLEDLVSRLNEQPQQLAINPLEFSGVDHEITAQAVYGSTQVAYFVIAILPPADGGYE